MKARVELHTFFELARKLDDATDASVERFTSRFVVFDLHRLILFHQSPDAGAPSICSLVRFLEDGNRIRPLALFAAAESGRQYRFGFDLATLDVVPRSLKELKSGEYTVMDLLTGEILPGDLRSHPAAAARLPISPAKDRPQPSPLRAVVADRGLRSRHPPDLESLVGEAAGIIRRETFQPTCSSLALATTVLSANRVDRLELCHGKSRSPVKARAVARCEAAERFQIVYQDPASELVCGTYAELTSYAIDPRSLFFGRGPECPNDEGRTFDSDIPICWTWAWGAAERAWRLVPAAEVWFTSRAPTEPLFAYTSSSGCAVGATLEEAAVFGVLESIERDGFLTSWYLRRPATEIDLDSLDTDELNDLLARFRHALANYRPVLLDLTTDIGVPIVGGLAIREAGNGPKVTAATAAHIDPQRACARVLEDLMATMPNLTPQRLAEVRDRGGIVPPSPQGHFELYALEESFERLDFLKLGSRPPIPLRKLCGESPVPRGPELRLDTLLTTLAERFRDVGAGLYIKDITHAPLAECGLRAVRVVTPGLYPLWFGSRYRRFAVTPRLRRLAIAYTGRPLNPTDLNLEPHPLT